MLEGLSAGPAAPAQCSRNTAVGYSAKQVLIKCNTAFFLMLIIGQEIEWSSGSLKVAGSIPGSSRLSKCP